MNRREFLYALAAASASAAFDPERLLWVPRVTVTVPTQFIVRNFEATWEISWKMLCALQRKQNKTMSALIDDLARDMDTRFVQTLHGTIRATDPLQRG